MKRPGGKEKRVGRRERRRKVSIGSLDFFFYLFSKKCDSRAPAAGQRTWIETVGYPWPL